MTTTTYMIEDAHGTTICDGLDERAVWPAAKAAAERMGAPVYVWEPDADEATEVAPE